MDMAFGKESHLFIKSAHHFGYRGFTSARVAAEDRMKIGKEYKIGVVVSVNVSALRKDLEDAGMIKSLNAGF